MMNKHLITEFVLNLECEMGFTLYDREDDNDETICSKLLESYFMTIETINDVYEDLIKSIEGLQM